MGKKISDLVSGSPATTMADADQFEIVQSAASKGGVLSQLWTYVLSKITANASTVRSDLGLAASATTDTTNAANISSGTLPAGRMPALTGDVTTSAGAVATAIGAGKVTNAMLAGGIDLTAKVTNILPTANGGTANAFFTVSGPATAAKTFTFPNASATVLTTNAAVTVGQGGTGTGTAGGTALDNISGFSSTGFLKRTGGGTYAFVADPLPIANGGTNAASASGTALDNITGFSSTGFLKRTGAGTYAFVTDPLPVANGGTGDTGTAWTAYTPTLNASSGTFTSATASGRYKTLGKTVWFQITVSITTNGTAAGTVGVTLPFATLNNAPFFGRENAVSGIPLMAIGSGGTAGVTIFALSTGGYPGSNGASLTIGGVYEST